MVDLNEVSMFIQVARSGSFVEAARRLDMPSATISRRIQNLEADLGTRLMQRSTRKLTLTSAGESLRDRCAQAVDELVEAGQLHKADSTQISGTIRVAAPAGFFSFFQMEWVHTFLKEFPKVRVDFVLNDDLIDLISERIDIAFRTGPVTNAGFVARRIFTISGGLVASPAYLSTYGMPEKIEDLESHECIALTGRHGHATWRLQDAYGSQNEIRVKGRLSGNTQGMLLAAARAGIGIAALPTIISGRDLENGTLTRVLPGYVRATRGLSLVYPSRQQRPLAASRFAEMAVEKLTAREFVC